MSRPPVRGSRMVRTEGGGVAGRFDLVVVGGGPAGAVAAWLAARDGRRVALIDPEDTPPRLEGLGLRLQGWLRRNGLYDAAGMGAVAARRSSLWAGTASAANAEVIVERAAMDAWLRNAARRAGATLLRGTAAPRPGGVLMADGGTVAARMVFDARGRRAHRQRPRARGPATVAIGAALGVPADTPASTLVLPLDEGWLWLACPGGPRAWVQLTLDAADPQGRTPCERLAAGLDAAAARLPPLRQVGPLLVRDAAAVLPAAAASLEVVPVGDAVAAMDPLSGHGMFWAVSSALAATAVRRTLERADNAATRRLALRFLDQRQGDVYLRQARLGRDFIRSEAARAHLPFWSRRAAFPDDAPLDVGEGAAIARRVVVADGRLAEAEVLVTRHSPAGVAWIGDRPAATLFRAWCEGAGRDELARRFDRAGAIFPDWLARETGGGR